MEATGIKAVVESVLLLESHKNFYRRAAYKEAFIWISVANTQRCLRCCVTISLIFPSCTSVS